MNAVVGGLGLLNSGALVVAAFLLAGVAEAARPWRRAETFAGVRWLSNLALLGFAAGLDYLVTPVIASFPFSGLGGGLPLWAQLTIGVAVLDALSYGLHRAFHASPILWRLHALHHADPELDVTTTVRHHPGEALLMAFALGALGNALGFPLSVVGFYASVNLSVQLFAHANIELSPGLANALGWLVVTPVLHRVHHSRCPTDIDTNYGLVFSVWDRLFATYRSNAEYGEGQMEFGLDRLREGYYQRLDRMLWTPLLVSAR